MQRTRLAVNIVTSLIVLAVAACFFFYPAFVTARVLLERPLLQGAWPSFTLGWFTDLSQRYAKWADEYVASQYAASLNDQDVAATEWPMFGSVFYLLAAEEVQDSLEGPDDPGTEKIRDVLLKASSRAAAIIANPTTGTWVRKKWGESYLTEENVFYRMLLIMGLSSYERISGDAQYHSMLNEHTQSLAAELLAAQNHLRNDYPGECYPSDVLWAVAAIQRADTLLGTDHAALKSEVMGVLTTRAIGDGGLPALRVDAKSADPLGPSRGCGNSGILLFAHELHPETAGKWYQTYEDNFWQQGWFLAGFREFSRTYPHPFSDVDSGLVLWQYGSVASAFGIGAARIHGRFDRSVPLTQEAIACSWPTPFGLALPSLMGWCAADAPCLGEVALLFSMTRPTAVPETVASTGSAPGIVWALLGFYVLYGVRLVYGQVTRIRKWRG